MPGQVTGTIGEQEVRLDNAATESTLELLVRSMDRMGKALGVKGKDYAKEIDNFKKKIDLDKKGVVLKEDENKKVGNLNRGLENLGSTLGRAVNNISSASNIAGNLIKQAFTDATPTVEGFASKIPIVGGLLGAMGGVLDSNIKHFRELAQAGVDLGKGIYAAQRAAARAGLPLEVFAKTVRESSQGLALFAGSASAGAQVFTDTMASMKKSGFTKSLAQLGMSMDEIAANTASYMEIQARTGRAGQMTQTQITQGAMQYNEELDKLARATGIQRKTLDEANKAAARDARMRTALAKLEPAERQRVLARIKQMEEAGAGEAAEGLKDLIASGGVAVTQNARNLTLTNRQFAEDARAISRGQQGSVEGLDKTLRDTAKNAQNMGEGARLTATTLATMGKTTPMYMALTMEGFTNAGNDIKKATKDQVQAKADESKKIAALDQTLTDLINKLKATLIDSGLLEKFADLLITKLIPATEQLIQVFSKVVEFLSKNTWVENLMLALGAGLTLMFAKAAASNMIGNILEKVGLGGPGGAGLGGPGGAAGKGGLLGKLGSLLTTYAIAAGGGFVADAAMGQMGVGNKKINETADQANWEKMTTGEKFQSGLARGVEKLGEMFFLGNLVNQAKSERIANESAYLKGRTPGTPTGSMPAAPNTPSSAVPGAQSKLEKPASVTPEQQKVAEAVNSAKATPSVFERRHEQLMTTLNAKLDQLNTNMATLIEIQNEAKEHIGKTAKHSKAAAGKF